MNKSVKNKNGLFFIIGLIVGLFSVNINIDLIDIVEDFKIYKNLQLENEELKNQITLLNIENDSLKTEKKNFENNLQVEINEIPIYNQSDNNIDNNDLIIQISSVTAYIHSAPRNSSKKIAVAKQDDIIILRRIVEDKDKHEWYEVLVGNQIGYVRSYLARELE